MLHAHRFPNETDAYREARNDLLQQEMELRRLTEAVASQRRQLPLGGQLKENYAFDEGPADLSLEGPIVKTVFADLFDEGSDTLILYSFMFGPNKPAPCPLCNSIISGFNGNAHHIRQRASFAVVAKSPIGRVREWARKQQWHRLRLLSSHDNSYNADYLGEDERGNQLPSINVFQRTSEGVFHIYNSEMLFAPSEPGQDARHVDALWPLWNVLDLTPAGRGTDWYPDLG